MYKVCESTDRESSMVSYTDQKGKTTILHSEDSEKTVKQVTCKDSNGISNTFSKESERKSVTVCCEKGKGKRKPCTDCRMKCLGNSYAGTDNEVRYQTKVSFKPS